MPALEPSKHVPLPKQWSSQIQSVVLHVISLAQYALTQARGWAADSVNPRLRLSAKVERLETEVATVGPFSAPILPPRWGPFRSLFPYAA